MNSLEGMAFGMGFEGWVGRQCMRGRGSCRRDERKSLSKNTVTGRSMSLGNSKSIHVTEEKVCESGTEVADEPRALHWEHLTEHLKVAKELGLCPEDNGEALVTSAFQLPCPDLASHSVLTNVSVRKKFIWLMRHTPWLELQSGLFPPKQNWL